MDLFQHAALYRARDSIALALGDAADQNIRKKAIAFVEAARLIGLAGTHGEVRPALQATGNATLQKAVAENTSLWGGSMRTLAESFIQSISGGDLLSQLARYAKPVPAGQRSVMTASGFSADVTAEGGAKVTKNLSLSIDEDAFKKVAAIVVMTKELLNATDGAALELIRAELASAVLRGSNSAALADLPATSTVATTGSAIGDLRAGLKAAGASNAYVVAASRGIVNELALEPVAGPGFGVGGGDFRPGVSVVAVDEFSGLRIIPASRLAIYNGAPELRASSDGTVNMSTSPAAPSAVVSLFQTGCAGVICERAFNVFGDVSGIVEVS